MKKNRMLIWSLSLFMVIVACAGIKEKFTGSKDKELIQTYLSNGEKYENEGNLVEALKQYKLALTVDPQNQDALDSSNRLENKMHLLADEHYYLGLELNKKGKYELAKKEFLTALRLQPDHMGALNALKGKKQVVAKKYIVHTIQPGESLSLLAKKYYGDYKKFPIIAKFNDMPDATQTKVGQKIKIPEIEGIPFLSQKKTAGTGEKYIVHTIQPGESLSLLAKKYYGDYKKFYIISDYNNMTDATQITVGQKIKVPEIGGMPPIATKEEIKTEEVKAPESVPVEPEVKEETKEEMKVEEGEETGPEEPEPMDQLEGYRSLGIEHFNNNEYLAAIAEFDKVLNANPDDKPTIEYLYNSHFQYGIALFEKKDYLAAKKNFEAALQYNKDCQKCRDYIKKSGDIYMDAHYNKGLSYFQSQKLPQAIQEWELVQAVDPHYKNVENDIKKAKVLLKRLEDIKKSMGEPGNN